MLLALFAGLGVLGLVMVLLRGITTASPATATGPLIARVTTRQLQLPIGGDEQLRQVTPVVVTAPRPERSGKRVHSHWWRWLERGLVFAIPCALYLVVAAVLVFRYASFNGDAQARLANAYYVLYSRDPHLAAVGFVWNPLNSLAVLPLLPLKAFFPALTTRAFAINIESALFMAGACYQLYEFFRDLELGPGARLGLTAVFAFNPMIIYYGANGMTEGMFIFLLVVTARYLARWIRDDRLLWLAVSATALGVAYLARNEAVFAAAFGILVVAYVAFFRGGGTRKEKAYRAATDGVIFALPFIVCFVGWAAVSWVIVGHPFEQFQSVYGTSSQLRVLNQASTTVITTGEALRHSLVSVAALAPTLLLVSVAALAVAVRRKDLRVLSALAVPGGVLVFAVLAYAAGQTAGWFRYYITAVPLLVMAGGTLLACLLKGPRANVSRPAPGRIHRLRVWTTRAAAAGLVIALVAPSLPSTAWAMFANTQVAGEEHLHLDFITRPKPHDVGQQGEKYRWFSTRTMAQAFDAMHLPDGAILIDNFTPCVPYIILNSKHPRQFVIPNDEDFLKDLQDPLTFHVQYLVAPPHGGYGALDAVNRAHVNLYIPGADIATEVRHWSLPGCPRLTLFKVNQ